MHQNNTQYPPLVVSQEASDSTTQALIASDYVNHVVPLTARLGRWRLTMSYWALLSAMVWLFYGALLSTLYGTIQALIAIAAMVITMSVLACVFTRSSIKGGLNSNQMARGVFGVIGASLTSLLMASVVTYYLVFESSALAVALKIYTGADLPMWFWYGLVSLAMLPLMLGSVESWMSRLNGFLLPFYVISLILVVAIVAINHSFSREWLHFAGMVPAEARPVPGWIMGFCLMMGAWVLFPTAVDFARFGKIEDVRSHSAISFGSVFYLWLVGINGVAGIFLVRTMLPGDPAQEAGVVQAILSAGGIFGMLLIIVTQTRINTLNYYETSMNFERLVGGMLGIKLRHATWVIIVGLLAFVLMLTDIFSYLQRSLEWQSAFFVGWAGIVGTHLLVNARERRNGLEFRPYRVKLMTPGLFAWIASSAVGIALAEAPGVFPLLSAVGPIVSLAVAIGLYLILWKLNSGERLGHALDPRDEVADVWDAWIRCDTCKGTFIAYEMDRKPDTGATVCDECATLARFKPRHWLRPRSADDGECIGKVEA